MTLFYPHTHTPRNRLEHCALIVVALFVFVIPWENAVIVGGFGTISRMLGVAAFGAAVGLLLTRRYIVSDLGLSSIFLFVSYLLLVGVYTKRPEATEIRVYTFLQLAAMCFVIYQACNSIREFVFLVRSYFLGCVVAACMVSYAVYQGAAVDWARFSATGFDPNDSAVIIATGAPIAFWLRRIGKGLVLKTVALIYPFGALTAVLATGSRTGTVALLIALFGGLWSTFRHVTFRQGVTVLLLGVICIPALMYAVPGYTSSRILNLWSPSSVKTFDFRAAIWAAGLLEFRNSPIVGGGPGTFSSSVTKYFSHPMEPHNAFISVLVELGMIGFLAFLWVVVVVIRGLTKITPPNRVYWCLVLVTIAVGSLTLNFEWRKQTWLLFTFIMIYGRVAEGAERSLDEYHTRNY